MAEISYPFNASNPNGGTSIVSETQWQAMASMWGGDRVDFQLTATSYGSTSLPFNARIINGRTVEVSPGKAWVGGFYYQNTDLKTVTVASNATSKPRKDLVVLQADMAKSAVNLVILTGTAAATPVAPQPRRQAGGLWEMPLYEVDAAANNASVTISGRMPFNAPTPVTFPWNETESAKFLPRGSFMLDMDNNGGDSQFEAFNGRDGHVVTRHFGKSRTYTPALLFDSNLPTTPSLTYNGRWRWIAPNTVWFSLVISNNFGTMGTDNTTAYGVTLPVPANGKTGQGFTGVLNNPSGNGGYPTFNTLFGRVAPGKSPGHFAVYMPSPTTPSAGLDNFRLFPFKSTITFSGVYEANAFNE
ncbi:hypothetical protein [Streptomyces wuyuanensis]|uniref:hypothetical protein n=1 Tax=Streptomyces wuyuanensis TaxID=1196353 RepID=UPI003413AA11